MRRPLPLLLAATVGISACVTFAGPVSASPAASSAAASRAPAGTPDQLVVGYVAGATESDKSRARGRASAARQEQVVAARADRNAVELVRLPAGKDRDRAEAQLEADPAVAYAEPNWVYTYQATSNDPYYTDSRLWGMHGDLVVPANEFGSQADDAWARGNTGSASVFVGVIDEGIQLTHPELSGQVWVNTKETDGNGIDDDRNGYVDDMNGWDFANGDKTVYDGGTRGSLDDHGTHVAGTIGAKRNGSGVVGVNWNTTLISGKFLGRNGGTLSNAIKAVDYFTDLKTRHGLNLVATNNSWGGGGFSQALLDAIVRGARQNILFIAAAGNSGDDNDITASYPSNYDTTSGAGYDAVIAVAAIDKAGALASFSQYGAKTVDLGAPGVGVWSTTAFNTLSSYSGTSMATPHVTGGAALYAASHPGTDAATIKRAILSSTVFTPSLNGKTVTNGRLNVSDF